LFELVIEKEPWGETFNAGTGRPTRILDLAKLVMKLFDVDGEPAFASPRPGDIRHSYADITKARRILSFEPAVSLEEGLRLLTR
ncbi:MAG: epimerase, partial [Infirmifilum sp.]